MKGVFVILDGVSDLPVQALGQKTPLEVAKTPNLNQLAKKSRIDYCYTVKEGVAPQSSNAVVSLLGRDPNEAPRGPLEVQGAGVKLTNGDLAFRTNFATIDNLEDLNILDRRAGRNLTTKEAKILAKEINKKVKLPYKFEFYPTVHHRGVLVIRGGFSDNITNVDPAYGRGVVNHVTNEKVRYSHPIDDEDDSKLSSEIINKFVRKSFEVLDKHPINIKRAKKGLFSANVILCRGAGNKPVKFKKLKGRWASICYMPLEIGIAKACQMDVYKMPTLKMKNMDLYANLYKTLDGFIKHAVKTLKRSKNKYDYFYIHFKKTDTPGHDNLPFEKIRMIELIDKKFFGFLKNFAKDSKIVITADHTTACKLKSHTADPVPVLSYPIHKKIPGQSPDRRFTEFYAKKGKKILGRKLLDTTLFID